MDKVVSIGKSILGTGETGSPENCPKKFDIFFENAAKEFIQIICENIYTNDNMNVKDSLNKTIINFINKSLNKPETLENMQTIVFGSYNSGLTKYIQQLFTFSMKAKNDNVYPFMERVLKIFINKNDKIIPEILSEALIQLVNDSNEETIPEDKILFYMEQIIKIKLDNPDAEDYENIEEINTNVEDTTQNMGVDEGLDEEANFEIVEKDLSKKTSKIVNVVLTHNATDVNNKFIEYLSNDDSKYEEEIQKHILTAIDNMMDKMKDNIYDKIKEIVDKYTEFFLNEKKIKLQILYSILSYKIDELDIEIKQEQGEGQQGERQQGEQKEGEGQQGEQKEGEGEQGEGGEEKESTLILNSINNTFFIIHKIFKKSIKKFMDEDFNIEDNNTDDFIKTLCIGDSGKSKGILFHLNKVMKDELSCRPGSLMCKGANQLTIGNERNEVVATNPPQNVAQSVGGTKRRRKRKTIKKSKKSRKSKRRYHKKSIRK